MHRLFASAITKMDPHIVLHYIVEKQKQIKKNNTEQAHKFWFAVLQYQSLMS